MDKKILALILAGGKGTRLESLTKKNAKPAISFAAKYRIIDFVLSNVANSEINNVAVLVQYESIELDSYIGNGEKWGLNGQSCQVHTIAPRQTEDGVFWYKGTADAVTANIDFIDRYNPDAVLVLSGDHVYKTTYNELISYHFNNNCDATLAVKDINIEESYRYGIVEVDNEDKITSFKEKPKKARSNLANMGVYVFNWKMLRRYLLEDKKDKKSSHDFGKDVLPNMIKDKKRLLAYHFNGYWRDVGTLESLHAANMDLCLSRESFNLYDWDSHTRIFTEDTPSLPLFVGKNAKIINSLTNQGAVILGEVNACVISNEVMIGEGAKCDHSVIMTGAIIEEDVELHNAIVSPGTRIKKGSKINVGNNAVILVE